MTDPLGFYKIFDIGSDVDDRLLKIKYRDKAKIWHPDHNKEEGALEQFQKISEAYNILSNPKQRFVYDLLSLVYGASDFPDMKTLKIYKSAKGEETPFLRVFKLKKVNCGKTHRPVEEENLIGTFFDAEGFIKDITKHNWLKGWWCSQGIKNTCDALKENYRNIDRNPQDNFKMLVHNAAAYYAESKEPEAYLSLAQALSFCPPHCREKAESFLAQIPAVNADMPFWDYDLLRKIQLRIPRMLVGVIIVSLLLTAVRYVSFSPAPESKNDNIAYYQEVHFNNGMETVDDVIVSKVFNIPVDTTDIKMLYYVTEEVNVMYGPSADFDVIMTARLRQTVRVTGYTPDQKWVRVMLDNGEMGFVEKKYLKAGIGRDIPSGSKIFKNPAL